MATATHPSTLVGIFDTREAAHRAAEELHRAGFHNHQITVVHHATPPGDVEVTDLDAAKAAQVSGETKEVKASAVGAVAGALIGGAVAVATMAIPGLGAVVIGGSLIGTGVLAGVATGVGVGVVGGGIVGALVGLDIPEPEARLYEQELKAGRALVGVRAGDRANEAWDILRLNGGRELHREAPVDVLPEVRESISPLDTGL
jgi:hypothetical protein